MENEMIICGEVFFELPKGVVIDDPGGKLYAGTINKENALLIGARTDVVLVSKRALKHIIERHPGEWRTIILKMPETISSPDKIVDNTGKREGSFLFAKVTDKAHGVVLEVLKNPDRNEVVTSYMIDAKTFKKIKDVAGGTDVPSSAP